VPSKQQGGRAIGVAADVSSEPDVERLFETCDRDLGPPTALVNNAGILEKQMRVEAMDGARIQAHLCDNVIGSFSARGKRCVACQPNAAALGVPLSMSRQAHRGLALRGVCRLRSLERGRGHVDDRIGEGKSRMRAFGSTRCVAGVHLHGYPRKRRRAGTCRSREAICADEAWGNGKRSGPSYIVGCYRATPRSRLVPSSK